MDGQPAAAATAAPVSADRLHGAPTDAGDVGKRVRKSKGLRARYGSEWADADGWWCGWCGCWPNGGTPPRDTGREIGAPAPATDADGGTVGAREWCAAATAW